LEKVEEVGSGGLIEIRVDESDFVEQDKEKN